MEGDRFLGAEDEQGAGSDGAQAPGVLDEVVRGADGEQFGGLHG